MPLHRRQRAPGQRRLLLGHLWTRRRHHQAARRHPGPDNRRRVGPLLHRSAGTDPDAVRGIVGVYLMAAPLGSLTDRYGPRMYVPACMTKADISTEARSCPPV